MYTYIIFAVYHLTKYRCSCLELSPCTQGPFSGCSLTFSEAFFFCSPLVSKSLTRSLQISRKLPGQRDRTTPYIEDAGQEHLSEFYVYCQTQMLQLPDVNSLSASLFYAKHLANKQSLFSLAFWHFALSLYLEDGLRFFSPANLTM